MELKVGALTGAALGEKSATRLVQRDGYRGPGPRGSLGHDEQFREQNVTNKIPMKMI